ncbi:pilus assembly PilX N-terminal domain-containing protein [Candidatus Poribacteria bacterium]|nr:pilus assembly PilX N-terminal domain-containing protein [Candidatus Poribacteria bacterium]
MLSLTNFNSAKGIAASIKLFLSRLAGNKSGNTVIFALVFVSILVILGGAIANTVILESRDAYRQLHHTQAFYLAEAGIMRTWQEFKDGATDLTALLTGTDGIPGTADDGVLSFGSSVSLGSGNYSVIITDNDDGDGNVYSDTDYVILVNSTGTVSVAPGITKTIQAYMQVIPPPSPANVRSSIVTAGPIQILGAIRMDGRDHDLNGNLIPDSGLPGISTVQTFQQEGASKVGGTADGVDYSPSKPGNPAIIETNADWSAEGGFPNTPDKFVRLPEGTLKFIAQSGKNGSQYVTDPSLLTFPLSGVTYVELAHGASWSGVNFDNSSGILVVHNTATNAIMTNLNGGTFRGLIIADDLIHIHNTIIGAGISLTSAPSEGNCIGNGTGKVLYSREAIAKAAADIGPTISMKSWFR